MSKAEALHKLDKDDYPTKTDQDNDIDDEYAAFQVRSIYQNVSVTFDFRHNDLNCYRLNDVIIESHVRSMNHCGSSAV